MTFKEYYNHISPLKEETWKVIEPFFHRAVLPKHQHFVRENDVATKIAFLESGIVRAYFTNREGQEYNKQFFVGPSSIGAYSSLLTGQPNLIPQQALTDCVVWAADYRDITRHYDRFADLERLSRKVAEYYFIEKEKKELEIVLLDADERYKRFQKEFPGVEQQIPQYHIASYLGISAVQLSRIRHQWAKK